MKLDFRDPDPVIIDLSPEGGRVEGLQESKIECLTNDKVWCGLGLYWSDLFDHPLSGCLSLLLPAASSWPLAGVPFVDRRDQARFATARTA